MEVSGRKDEDLSFSQLHSSDDVQLYCQLCKQDKSLVPAYGYCQNCAEHLCETCYKSHRKPAPCRNHILLDKQQMPQTQSSLPLTLPAPSDLTEMCEQHPGKVIEYFCKDHKVLGCCPCMTMKHRTCKFDYIPEVSSKYVASPEYENLLQSLKHLHEHFKQITEAAKDNENIVLKNENTVKEDIKRFREEINRALDMWEAAIYTEIEKHLSEEIGKVESVIKQSKDLAHKIETTINDFKALEQDDKINMLYLQGKTNKESLNKYRSDEQHMQQDFQAKPVTFQPSLAITKLLQSEKTLGNVLIHSRDPRVSVQQTDETIGWTPTIQKPQAEIKVPSFEDISAELSGQINVMTTNNTTDCCITGIVVIDTDELAVVDKTNNSVKVIDVKQKTVISDLKLSSNPWDLVQLPEYQLAVSLPREQLVHILSYLNGLSKISQMKAGGMCYGLAYSDGNLIVTYGGTTESVKILSLHGTVLKTLYTDDEGVYTYIAVDRKSAFIYASDIKYSKVISLKKKGTVTGTFVNKELSEPRGLAVLEDGSLLLCISGNKICLISADLKKSRIILQETDGLYSPFSVACDIKEKKFYVGSGKRHNYVNVYSYK